MINLLCLLCSLCVQFCALGLPYDVSNFDDMSLIKDYLLSSQGVPDSFLWFADTPNAPYIVLRYSIQNDNSRVYNVGFPVSSFNSSISSSAVISNGEFINNGDFYRGDITFIGWDFAQFVISSDHSTCYLSGGYNQTRNYQTKFLIPTDNFTGIVTYQRVEGANAYSFYDNTGNLIFLNESVLLPGIGSLSPGGHSSVGSPLESLQGFSWTAHSSIYTPSGHNTHVNSSNATPDFTNATQNLLGQIVDNTNSIISNTNSLGGALETINGNIINGASAIFNSVSQLNSNFVSSVIIDKEELNDQWTASNTYLAFASMQNSFNLLQSTADDLIDRYSATEDVDELIIPIDLTVWQISSIDYGNFKPFDEVYYMRFGFLDETKALWQPLFIALLYFCLFFSIVLDLPNIIRGAK